MKKSMLQGRQGHALGYHEQIHPTQTAGQHRRSKSLT